MTTRLAGSLVVTPEQIADAIRLLVERNHVVAEGAGAASVAAALAHGAELERAGAQTIACVVSGGNIDLDALATILRGGAARAEATLSAMEEIEFYPPAQARVEIEAIALVG